MVQKKISILRAVHDINNLLASIQLSTELMSEEVSQATRRRYKKSILKDAKKIQRLLKILLL